MLETVEIVVTDALLIISYWTAEFYVSVIFNSYDSLGYSTFISLVWIDSSSGGFSSTTGGYFVSYFYSWVIEMLILS